MNINCLVPVIGEVLPIIGRVLPAIGSVLLVIGRALPAIGRVLPAIGRVLPAISEVLPIIGRIVPAICEVLPVIGASMCLYNCFIQKGQLHILTVAPARKLPQAQARKWYWAGSAFSRCFWRSCPFIQVLFCAWFQFLFCQLQFNPCLYDYQLLFWMGFKTCSEIERIIFSDVRNEFLARQCFCAHFFKNCLLAVSYCRKEKAGLWCKSQDRLLFLSIFAVNDNTTVAWYGQYYNFLNAMTNNIFIYVAFYLLLHTEVTTKNTQFCTNECTRRKSG